MGNKEKTLEDLIVAADERISTLRGLQKDLRTVQREIDHDLKAHRAWISSDLHDKLERIVEQRLLEMYAALEETEKINIERVSRRVQDAFDVIYASAFGTRSLEEIKSSVAVIRAVTEELHKSPWRGNPNTVQRLLQSMIVGLPGGEQVRHDGTTRLVGATAAATLQRLVDEDGTPPHASVQDKPHNVV